MSDSAEILYKRVMAHGPEVRIRRVSVAGAQPVSAVLEVDRRAGTARAGIGFPPSLAEASGSTDEEVVAALRPSADDDSALARLMRERGLR